MIIEGLVATQSSAGVPHLAVMGAVVDDAWQRVELRPFSETQTYRNLMHQPSAVFHTTDQIDLMVQLIVGVEPQVEWIPARCVPGSIYAGCCRYFELAATYSDPRPPRADFHFRVAAAGELRPAVGFNRGRHLILEAAILASRVDFLPREEWIQKFAWFEPIIRKTGAPEDLAAFERLQQFLQGR